MNLGEIFVPIYGGIVIGLCLCALVWVFWLDHKKPKPPKLTNAPFYYVDVMPWSKTFRKRCKARLKRGEDPAYYGRCELMEHDEMFDHCLERGMDWVRWHERAGYKDIYYTGPEYKKVRH